VPFLLISSVFNAKTGINYTDLEPGNKFWNRVRVLGFCYKSLHMIRVRVKF